MDLSKDHPYQSFAKILKLFPLKILKKRGVLPVIRVGRLRRVRQADVEKFIMDQIEQHVETKTGLAAGTAGPIK